MTTKLTVTWESGLDIYYINDIVQDYNRIDDFLIRYSGKYDQVKEDYSRYIFFGNLKVTLT